jgi:hypothetical protein
MRRRWLPGRRERATPFRVRRPPTFAPHDAKCHRRATLPLNFAPDDANWYELLSQAPAMRVLSVEGTPRGRRQVAHRT